LREGYKVFLERLEQHNSQLPPTEDPIRKIGYAQNVEVMTGKGYSRLKPCQTGLCATCQDYGRENFDALKAWGTDVRKFCERIELGLSEMFCKANPATPTASGSRPSARTPLRSAAHPVASRRKRQEAQGHADDRKANRQAS
jgi:hypothetical protein